MLRSPETHPIASRPASPRRRGALAAGAAAVCLLWMGTVAVATAAWLPGPAGEAAGGAMAAAPAAAEAAVGSAAAPADQAAGSVATPAPAGPPAGQAADQPASQASDLPAGEPPGQPPGAAAPQAGAPTPPAAGGASQPANDPSLAGEAEPARADPVGTRLIDVATPFTVGRQRLELLFTHRFVQAVNQGGNGHNLFGLDSGADVGIGLTYGLLRHLDLSVYRSSFQEDYELAAKLQILDQAAGMPLSAAVRGGADLLGRLGVEDPHRPFAQVLLARRLAAGWNLFASPSWVHGTPLLRDAWNVPLGFTVPLPGKCLLDGEAIAADRALHRMPGASRFAWHSALSKQVGWHLFQIVVGNSRATTVDQIVGGDSAAGFNTRDVRLGFNLVRYFNL